MVARIANYIAEEGAHMEETHESERVEPAAEEVDIDSASDVVKQSAIEKAHSYAKGGLWIAGGTFLVGFILFLMGVAWQTKFVARGLGLEFEFSDAWPGAILWIVGVFVIALTRFRVRIGDKD